MTDAEKYRLKQQAQQFWDAAKQHLLQTIQPGSRHAFSHGLSRSGDRGAPSPYAKPQQGMSFKSGRMPSDTEITEYVNKVMGGNPYEKKLREAGMAQVTPGPAPPKSSASTYKDKVAASGGPSAGPQSDPMGMFNQMLMLAQGKMDEANAANIARYDEGKGLLQGLREGNQARAQNWGHAAQADIDDRMKDALLNSEASLASRGLGGSTIHDAFRQDAAQKTAREQQRVSEQRDARLVDYDTRDTNSLVGFIERRDDIGPDYNQMLSMAMQAGLAQQQAAEREKAAEAMNAALAQQQANRGTGGQTVNPLALARSGPRGGAMPMFVGANPLQMAQSYLGSLPNYSQLTSNRYPTPRGSKKKSTKKAAKKDMEAWMSGKRVMPTVPRPAPPLQLPYGPPQGPMYA